MGVPTTSCCHELFETDCPCRSGELAQGVHADHAGGDAAGLDFVTDRVRPGEYRRALVMSDPESAVTGGPI